MPTKIVIIGAGEIGQALALVLKSKKVVIEMWDRDLSRVPKQKPLEEIIPTADYVFLCVPSQAVRLAVLSFKNLLAKKTGVICLSKGVELKTQKIMPEVLQEVLSVGQPVAMMGGPMLAEELRQGKPGVSVLATKNPKAFQELVRLFSGTLVRLELTNDVVGTAWSGVLKNVFAMALGMVDGLGWGANAQAWLLGECLTEMEQIAVMMGGKTNTVCYTAGLSDLVATGFSPYSKNRETGRIIVQTQKCCVGGLVRHSPRDGGEGAISFPAIWKKLGAKGKSFPILNILYRVLIKHQDAKKLFANHFRQA
ncbi:MAG: NAD(P)-dependent oxidoreductase [Candidatus Uhrbacteria bacterium]